MVIGRPMAEVEGQVAQAEAEAQKPRAWPRRYSLAVGATRDRAPGRSQSRLPGTQDFMPQKGERDTSLQAT